MKSSTVIVALVAMTSAFAASTAAAQSNTGKSSTFATSTAGSNDWSSSGRTETKSNQAAANKHHLGIGLNSSGLVVGGRWEVANGGVVEMDVVWRRAFNPNSSLDHDSRIEVGGVGRLGFTADAVMVGAGIPFRLVLGTHRNFEMGFALHLTYTRIYFSEPIFVPANGFIPSIRWEWGFFVDRRLSLGITPVAFSVIMGERVDPFVTYEPGLWVRYSPI